MEKIIFLAITLPREGCNHGLRNFSQITDLFLTCPNESFGKKLNEIR